MPGKTATLVAVMTRPKSPRELPLILIAVLAVELLVVLSNFTGIPEPLRQSPGLEAMRSGLPPTALRIAQLGIPDCVQVLRSSGNEGWKRKVLDRLVEFRSEDSLVISSLLEIIDNENGDPANGLLIWDALDALLLLRGDRAMEELIEQLNRREGHAQLIAAEPLIPYGTMAYAAIPSLSSQLSRNPNAGRALAAINPNGRGLPEALAGLAISRTSSLGLRLGSLEALGSLGSKATGVVGRVSSLLKPSMNEGSAISCAHLTDADRWQGAVITTLGQMGSGAGAAIPRLQPFLTNTSVALRVLATRSLWQITRNPKPLVPVLRKIIEDEPIDMPAFNFDFDVALSNPVLNRPGAMKSPRYHQRVALGTVTASVYLLGEMGKAAEGALPTLGRIKKNVQDYPCADCLFIVRAVSKITGDTSEFLSLLLKHLNSDSSDAVYDRIPVIGFLAEFGAAAEPAIARLQVLSTNKEQAVAVAAMNAIQRIYSSTRTTPGLPL